MQINRLLAAGCAIFPAGEEPVPTARPGQSADAPSPEGASGVAAAVQRASAGYRDAGARVAALTEALDETVSAAAAQGQQAALRPPVSATLPVPGPGRSPRRHKARRG